MLYPSYADKMEISSGAHSGKRRYQLLHPPGAFVKENFTDREIFFQIESDWSIYILKNGDFPAKEFPLQPEGYPLKPVVDGKFK